MSSSALILLATILTVDGNLVRIDKGYTDGVRTGDAGRIYYTLAVGPERVAKRIDVGRVEIREVGVSSAEFIVSPALAVRPGYAVEIEIPRSRFRPTVEILRLARMHLDAARYEEALGVLDTAEQMHRMGSEGRLASDQIERLRDEVRRRRAEAEAVLEVEAGSYTIGVDLAEARFHNQYPRFRTDVEAFGIDREPISSADYLATDPEHGPAEDLGHDFVTGVTLDAAEVYCRRLGKRLPTELEWEIAAQDPRFASGHPLHEWTSSWYLPYPGNDFPDEAYGESFKVLKGGVDAARPRDVGPRLRRFLDPDDSHPNVGFRCARDLRTRRTE